MILNFLGPSSSYFMSIIIKHPVYVLFRGISINNGNMIFGHLRPPSKLILLMNKISHKIVRFSFEQASMFSNQLENSTMYIGDWIQVIGMEFLVNMGIK